MPGLPTIKRYPVTRLRRFKTGTDELGNPTYGLQGTIIHVVGWAKPTAAEPELAGHARRTVAIKMYAHPGGFIETDIVILTPGGERLEVVGEPENYEHGPFGWAPELEVINLAGIE